MIMGSRLGSATYHISNHVQFKLLRWYSENSAKNKGNTLTTQADGQQSQVSISLIALVTGAIVGYRQKCRQ